MSFGGINSLLGYLIGLSNAGPNLTPAQLTPALITATRKIELTPFRAGVKKAAHIWNLKKWKNAIFVRCYQKQTFQWFIYRCYAIATALWDFIYTLVRVFEIGTKLEKGVSSQCVLMFRPILEDFLVIFTPKFVICRPFCSLNLN